MGVDYLPSIDAKDSQLLKDEVLSSTVTTSVASLAVVITTYCFLLGCTSSLEEVLKCD